MQRVVDGGVRYVCGSCHGHVTGLAPFERGHPGSGRSIWVASDGGTPAGRCPFCARDLVAPAMADPPPGLGVCRRCEQVWVPAVAEAWFGGRDQVVTGEARATVPAGHGDSCPGCGAPWAPDPAGCCRYCRQQLAGGSPTTVIIEAPRRPSSLLGLLEREW